MGRWWHLEVPGDLLLPLPPLVAWNPSASRPEVKGVDAHWSRAALSPLAGSGWASNKVPAVLTATQAWGASVQLLDPRYWHPS